MHNQSYNQLPLATNQSHNDMSMQMTPKMHQINMNQIPQNQLPQNQQLQYVHQQIPQMNQQHFQQPQQYQNQGQMMNQPQMMNQQYPIQQQQYMVYPQQQFKNQVTSRYTQPLYCSHCSRVVPTLVEFEAGKGAWLSGLLIGMLGCWGGCCLIPCCNEDFQDAVHYCTICAQKLGKKQFLFD